MEIKFLAMTEQNLKLQRNYAALLCLLMLISNLVLVISLFRAEKQIILVPPGLTREVTLSEYQLGDKYLEEISLFFLSKLLDLNTHNIGYQQSVILRHTSSSFYPQMKLFLAEENKKYAEYNLTTYFIPETLKIDSTNLTVIAKGCLYSQFARSGKNQQEVSYLLEFDYVGGILTISNFTLTEQENEAN
jgi:type IV conjugative transfer system protein TraE